MKPIRVLFHFSINTPTNDSDVFLGSELNIIAQKKNHVFKAKKKYDSDNVGNNWDNGVLTLTTYKSLVASMIFLTDMIFMKLRTWTVWIFSIDW